MYYSRFINKKNPSYFSVPQESAPKSEQTIKRAAQAECITIETGYSPIPSVRRSQITKPRYSILDLKDPSIAPRYFTPPSNDITTNFMLGHFAYKNKLGLSSLLASSNFFYQHFTPNSFIASALFPTTNQTFFEDNCHIVTEQTQQDFACNPLLPVIQRKLADYAFAQFGLRRFGQEVLVLSSFAKHPPYWVLSQHIDDRKLLMQMVTSLNLLGNQLLAKNLSHTVAKLLQRYGNPEARSFFILRDTINTDIKPQKVRLVSISQALRKQEFKTPYKTQTSASITPPPAPSPSYFYQSKALRTKPAQIVTPEPFSSTVSTPAKRQSPAFRSTPNLSKSPANKPVQDKRLQGFHAQRHVQQMAEQRQSLEFRSAPDLYQLSVKEDSRIKTPKKSFFPSVELVGLPRIKSFRRKNQNNIAAPSTVTSDIVTRDHEKNQIIIRTDSLYNQSEELTPQNIVHKQPSEFRSAPDLSKLPADKPVQDVELRQTLEFRSTPDLSQSSAKTSHVKTPKKSFFPSAELVGLPRIKSFCKKKQKNVATTNATTNDRYEKDQIIIRAYSLYNQRKEFTPQNSYGLKIFEDFSGRANRVFLFKGDEFIGYYDRNKSNVNPVSRDFKHLVQKNDDYLVFAIQNNRVIATERQKEHMITNGAYDILKNMNCIVPSYFINEDKLIVKNIIGENGREFILNDKKLKPSDFKDLINELEYCYDKGIFLSDIKFDNILIDKNNIVKFVNTDCIIDINRPDLLPNKLRIPMTRGLTPQILISKIAGLTSNSPPSQIEELLIKSNAYSLLMTMYDFSEGKSIPSVTNDNIIRKNDLEGEYIQDFFHWIDKHFRSEHVNSIKEFIADPLNKPIGRLSDML